MADTGARRRGTWRAMAFALLCCAATGLGWVAVSAADPAERRGRAVERIPESSNLRIEAGRARMRALARKVGIAGPEHSSATSLERERFRRIPRGPRLPSDALPAPKVNRR